MSRRPSFHSASLIAIVLALSAGHADATTAGPQTAGDWIPACEWVPGFHHPGLHNPNPEVLIAMVNSSAVFDDGSGRALYVAGGFDSADGRAADGLAKWNGRSWSAVPRPEPPASRTTRLLGTFNFGGTPALYAQTPSGIARFDGLAWTPLGAFFSGGTQADAVYALAEWTTPGGPVLLAAGSFATANGVPAANLAQWNGTAWSAFTAGTNGVIRSLVNWNENGLPRLYAGGDFTQAGGLPANRIARWNGAAWSALTAGVDDGAGGGDVRTLLLWNDGGGTALYVGGDFIHAGGADAGHIARWRNSSWSAVGPNPGGPVEQLAHFDSGAGDRLLAIGRTAGFLGVVQKDGASWTEVTGSSYVWDVEVFDEGDSDALFISGQRFQRWNGTALSPVEQLPAGNGLDGAVTAIAVHDDGSGPGIFVAGRFFKAGHVPQTAGTAKWSANAWSPLASGVSVYGRGLASFDDGEGSALYLADAFLNEFGALGHLWSWANSTWTALLPGTFPALASLGVFDDGSNPVLAIVAIAEFLPSSRTSVIQQWDGASLSDMGVIFGDIQALVTFDDGSGPKLYVGGNFRIGGTWPQGDGGVAAHVARWNGSAWSPVGTDPVAAGSDGNIQALEVFDDGTGEALFAGGKTSAGGGTHRPWLGKWDGNSWSEVGGGLVGSFEGAQVLDLEPFDDGTGNALYVSGGFSEAGGQPISGLVRWNGQEWSSVGQYGGTRLVALPSAARGSLFSNSGALLDGMRGSSFAQYCRTLVFASGFESGDTAPWSTSSPLH